VATSGSARPLDRYARMERELSHELGLRLRAAREEAGLSQQEFGEMLGYAPTMISAFEHGRRRMKVEDLTRACIALGKEPDYFLRTKAMARPADVRVAATLRAEVAALPQGSLREFISAFLEELEETQPVMSRVPHLGHLQPEAAAREVLDACGVSGPPVEVVDQICASVGIEVFWRELPEALSAMLITVADDQLVIVVNEEHSEVRRRFSVAHELGHSVLGHSAGYHIDYEAEAGVPPGYDWFDERQANSFAAALLMDERWVRRDVAEGKRGTRALSRRYRVSEAAMSFRLVNLGLA
jgi:transcriptional regulator with XRE-family HTH domain